MMDLTTGADLPLDVSSRVESLLDLVNQVGERLRGPMRDASVLFGLLRDLQENMMDLTTGADLPLHVRSRVEALLDLVNQIRERLRGPMRDDPVLFGLLRDFQEMARTYILLCEERLNSSDSTTPKDKWLWRHEMLDNLTEEWYRIYSLASAAELGSPLLNQFDDYMKQAAEDIGLTDIEGDFLLIPAFGESFSLVKVGYSSSNVAILNLPISVIHSPWELSVIWHELAGLKVIRIRERIARLLKDYADKNIKNRKTITGSQGQSESDPISELLKRIENNQDLDEDSIRRVKEFLLDGDGIPERQDEIWSQDWFEQLYEDACSVFAFGEEFISVLKTILSRQADRLDGDRKHPPLKTRIQVARYLLALQRGEEPSPTSDAERLTENLLWAFIDQTRSDKVAALPVAHADPESVPEVRQKLIRRMQEFNQNFGDLEGGTINESRFDFGSMLEFAEKASQNQQGMREKLLSQAEGPDILDLLKIIFSPSDELDIKGHKHQNGQSHELMSIRVHNKDHTVYRWGIKHV